MIARFLDRFLDRLLDRLLGERCHACGHRVFPRDTIGHYSACTSWWRP